LGFGEARVLHRGRRFQYTNSMNMHATRGNAEL
jgi:hypothetical protein